jgi:hypothetical protein
MCDTVSIRVSHHDNNPKEIPHVEKIVYRANDTVSQRVEKIVHVANDTVPQRVEKIVHGG